MALFIEIFPSLVNLLSMLAVAATFLLIVRGDLTAQVTMFRLQSTVLAVLAVLIALFAASMQLLWAALALMLIKGVIIPRVLKRVEVKVGLRRGVAPYLGVPSALAVCAALAAIAFYVMGPVARSNPLPTADAIPLAFAGVLIGFFVTVNRRRALTQILGFLMLENSIFLLALLCTYGVPFIVEMGVFLDLLAAVLIMEVFIYRIKENFDSIDLDRLGSLKG